MGLGSEVRRSISNVLVIGSGAAGLRAAIAATEAGAQTTVIGKRAGRDAHTVLAAGGINAALGTRDPEDVMWEHCGVVRDEPRLLDGLAKLGEVAAASAGLDVGPSAEGWEDLAHALDLRAALLTAEGTVQGAIVTPTCRRHQA